MNDLPINPVQAIVSEMSKRWQAERAEKQMTLGKLIETLEWVVRKLPNLPFTSFGTPHSYRGYYEDLAFEPTADVISASDLLVVARGCMGKIFVGYKGGDYMMGENTPLWIANYSDTGKKLVGLIYELTTGGPVTPVLEEDNF